MSTKRGQDQGPLDARQIGDTTANEDQFDPGVRELVRALNAFAAIHTLGSCGGHAEPRPGEWPTGTWYVSFEVERTAHGWRALEFLAWLINNDCRGAGQQILLYPYAPPPHLNHTGRMLRFHLEGQEGASADTLAAWIDESRVECFVPARRNRPG